MKTGFFIILLFTAFSSYGQERKDLAASIYGGVLNSPYYKSAKAKGFYGFSFDYHLKKRHVLAVNYFAGRHTYYDNVLSNNPTAFTDMDGNNADVVYHTFSVVYKYKVIDNKWMSLSPGVGAGIMADTQTYPYAEGVSKSYPKQSSTSDLVFPITLDVLFRASKNWQVGLVGGFVVHPDYPILALHAGPKLSYIIK